MQKLVVGVSKIFLRNTIYSLRIARLSMYASGVKGSSEDEKNAYVIDVRSDTVTKPTDEMKQAMFSAEVGDDVFGDDPTVNELQDKAAKLLGKESGLFVPSGCMGNLICIMAHCSNRGDEALIGDRSHISIYEQGSASQFGGVFARHVINKPDGTLDLDDLVKKIHDGQDVHYTHSKVICIEQTHNLCGGRVLPLSYIDKVKDIANANNLRVHMDGARLFNAVAALNVPVSTVVKHMDSVMFCLSKGLGTPMGSMIVGSKDFIGKCHRLRKALGGGMRQAGIIAAAGIYALDNIAPKIGEDNKNAQRLADEIDKLDGVNVQPKLIHTNMVYFEVTSDKVTADDIVQRMGTFTEDDPVVVKLLAISASQIRIVFHHQVLSSDVQKIVDKLKGALQQ